MENLRLVRLVTALSHCFCLRLVMCLVARLVRLVKQQVVEIIALDERQSAAPRSLCITYITWRLPWGPPARLKESAA